MAWTVTDITLDIDKPNVGTATAVWDLNDPDPRKVVTFSKRAEVSAQGAQTFTTEANAYKDAVLAKRASEDNLRPQLEGIMNA